MTTAAVLPAPQRPHQVRVVTAASLFDGHDAAINIMRRILQAQGAEVIHLGHDRSVDEIDARHRMLLVVLRNGLMRQIVLDYARDYERE